MTIKGHNPAVLKDGREDCERNPTSLIPRELPQWNHFLMSGFERGIRDNNLAVLKHRREDQKYDVTSVFEREKSAFRDG